MISNETWLAALVAIIMAAGILFLTGCSQQITTLTPDGKGGWIICRSEGVKGFQNGCS